MKTGAVFVEAVQVGQRLRSLNPEKIGMLAKSMTEIGLQQPISIWSPDLETIVLVAGLHRLEAAKQLKWDEIDCVYVDMGETEREMWEIAENLHRVDLTKEERDKHIRRYAELLEIKKRTGIDVQNGPQLGPGRPKEIPRLVADETGLSRQTVNRALNPPPATDPTKTPPEDDQERVYNNLCKWWRKADSNTRENFIAAWVT